jgi:phosphoribosyl-AMP cyclohydrolase / phosphoribosyl-ATP pyrophosphohydrolase
MLGWMDDEALARTLTTGRATYWSRSRQDYWVKGETSGNRQWVKEVRLDCDGDTLLVKVDQEGPACHTGERTCFFTGDLNPVPYEALPGLERTIADRATNPTDASYTAQLLADPPHIGEKVQEEAEEVVRAAREESDERVAEEAADVLYHLAVLLRSRGLSLADAEEVLVGRRR